MSIINKLYVFILFFYLMWGASAWFTWFLDDPQNGMLFLCIIIVGFIVSLIYAYHNSIKFSFNIYAKIGFFLVVLDCIIQHHSTTSTILFLIKYFPLIVVFLDKRNAKSILDTICLIFSWLLIMGLFIHLLFLIDIRFPGIPIVHPNHSYYTYMNYFVILKGIYYEGDGIRFHSVFTEPGFMGTLISFLLYAVKYDFSKKRNFVLFISLLFSLSLAGYVVTFVGYVLSKFLQKRSVIRIFEFSLFFLFFYLTASNFNGGKNYINERIFSRLIYDQEKGISGNNRVGTGTDTYFNQALSDGSFVWGIGRERIKKINGGNIDDVLDFNTQIVGAGYKIYILQSGVISILMILLFYVLCGPLQKKSGIRRTYKYIFIVLIAITFVQAAYPMSLSWLIPFFLGNYYKDN